MSLRRVSALQALEVSELYAARKLEIEERLNNTQTRKVEMAT